MIEKAFAGLTAAACLLLLIRLLIGERRRYRLDSTVLRIWRTWRRSVLRMWNWRSSRQHAARLAEEAISRARGKVEREGNVYKPKAFRKPRKPH